MGDLNSILNKEERVGSKVTYVKIKDLKECVEYYGLYEMKSSRCYYTWSNKQEGQDRVPSRIDRVFIDTKWVNKLPVAKVQYLLAEGYDHSPAIIQYEGNDRPRQKVFRYYNMWSMDISFVSKVEGSWGQHIQGSNMYKIVGVAE